MTQPIVVKFFIARTGFARLPWFGPDIMQHFDVVLDVELWVMREEPLGGVVFRREAMPVSKDAIEKALVATILRWRVGHSVEQIGEYVEGRLDGEYAGVEGLRARPVDAGIGGGCESGAREEIIDVLEHDRIAVEIDESVEEVETKDVQLRVRRWNMPARFGLAISGTSITWMPLAASATRSASAVHSAKRGTSDVARKEFASARAPW